MFFAIKDNKVVLAHRDLSIVASATHDLILEKDENILVYASYPEKLKVVDNEVQDKTEEEIEADEKALKLASIKEINKRFIRLRLRELGKEELADSILDANSQLKSDYMDSVSISTSDTDFLALLSAIDVTLEELLENYKEEIN